MSLNNSNQTNKIAFSIKHSKINHPSILLHGSQVNNIQVHNHVGLFLDSKLHFVHHITEKLSKVNRAIGVL